MSKSDDDIANGLQINDESEASQQKQEQMDIDDDNSVNEVFIDYFPIK